MMRKITILLVAAVAIAFLGFALVAFGLPKDQKASAPAGTGTPGKAGQPAVERPVPANPVPYGYDIYYVPNTGTGVTGDPAPQYRSLAPNKIGATTVPFIDLIPGGGTGSFGTVEFPNTNNYMRGHSVHLVGGHAQVHMVYPIYTGTNSSPWEGSTADSLQSRIPLFYNSYNVGGSGTLDYPTPGLRLSQVFPDLAPDDRKRELAWGGGVLNFTEPGQKVVAYGNRYIQATDLGAYLWWFRGTGTMQDVEGTGLFSMTGADTSMVDETDGALGGISDPVARAINESTWVATYTSAIGDANEVLFNYTSDRGQTWSVPIVSPMKTSWWNNVHISNAGNTFYLTGMSNPAVPTTYWVTERPCYVKGTYNPATGAVTFGALTDITGDFLLPAYLPIPHQCPSVVVGTTLHVMWLDWNNYNGLGFPGPGGHIYHASVASDGSVSGPHKIGNINIDGRLPDRSATLFGFMSGPWGTGEGLSYNSATSTLYAVWSQPREEYDAQGAPTFQWEDGWAGLLANMDIFYSASGNGGIAWDNPVNLSDTYNVGCTGGTASPCAHEDYFNVFPEVVADTLWLQTILRPKPGQRQRAFERGISPDPGSFQIMRGKIRLYKAPARAVVPSVRPDPGLAAGDTTSLAAVVIPPRGSHTVSMQLGNIGAVGFFLDSVTIDPSLDQVPADPEGLNVTHTAVGGTFIGVGGTYAFSATLDASATPVRKSGNRSGLLRAWCHTTDGTVVPPNDQATGLVAISVNVISSFCLNRQIRIHSANNSSDIGSQGSVADEAGTNGLFYDVDESNRYYDGGVWIANSELNAGDCEGEVGAAPRKVTRQIFGDDLLRCVDDGTLDSVATGGGAYNLYIRSVGTDVGDSTLVWESLWEQSTHPDSSDWLVQNVKVINVGDQRPPPVGTQKIDSVALGVLYDIDVLSSISTPARNTGGDTIILGADGRYYHMGFISGNDVGVDTCAYNAQLYGFIVIPDPLNAGPPGGGDTVAPRFASVYRQTVFSYNLDCHGSFGDSLAQRWSWNGTGFYSANGRVRFPNRTDADRWVYEYNDTLADNDTCLDGRLWRADMGYMTIAKKVYNFPVSFAAREQVARYGLASLAASVDTFFRGSGESYSVIHIGSVTALPGLIGNAQKAVKWFRDHAALQVAPVGALPWLRGDLNRTGITGTTNPLSGSDIVGELRWIFNDENNFGGNLANPLIPLCAVDINGDGVASASDVVALLNGTFGTVDGVNPSPQCPLCLTSCQ